VVRVGSGFQIWLDETAQDAERGIDDRQAEQLDGMFRGAQCLTGQVLSHEEQHAIGNAQETAVQEPPALPGSGDHGADEDAEHLQALFDQHRGQCLPEGRVGGQGRQQRLADLPQAVEDPLGQEEADHQTAPGRRLAGGQRWGRRQVADRTQRRLRRIQTHAAARTQQPAFKGALALGTDEFNAFRHR